MFPQMPRSWDDIPRTPRRSRIARSTAVVPEKALGARTASYRLLPLLAALAYTRTRIQFPTRRLTVVKSRSFFSNLTLYIPEHARVSLEMNKTGTKCDISDCLIETVWQTAQ